MSKSGTKINPANKGKLHKTLGVPKGEKIPTAKLEKPSSRRTRQRASEQRLP
jgi:hypothetical protein